MEDSDILSSLETKLNQLNHEDIPISAIIELKSELKRILLTKLSHCRSLLPSPPNNIVTQIELFRDRYIEVNKIKHINLFFIKISFFKAFGT